MGVIINSRAMDNFLNSRIIILSVFLVFIISCVTGPQEYKNELINNSHFSDVGIEKGFLKKDLKVSTPYGEMLAAACGRKSGYDYDFAYYKNGSLYIIFLKERKSVEYNGMTVILPSVNDVDKAFSARIEFFENFKIRFCMSLTSFQRGNCTIPANTRLHFNEDGNLESFTIYQDWYYQGSIYKDGQEFYVNGETIIPYPN
jgi:hypothetical protein